MASEQCPQASKTINQVDVNFVFAAKAQKLMNSTELSGYSFNYDDYTGISLKAEILRIFPQLKSIGDAMDIAVNEEYITSDRLVVLKDRDVIAVLPHVTAMDESDLFPERQEDAILEFLFFGIAGSLMSFGTCKALFVIGKYTGLSLKQQVLKTFQVLEPIKDTVIIALNGEYVAEDETVIVNKGDTIAVIPPLSGG